MLAYMKTDWMAVLKNKTIKIVMQNISGAYRKMVLILVALCALAACDLNDFTYSGPALVEFSHLSSDPPATWVSIGSIWATTLSGSREQAPLQVSLVSPQQSEDVEIGYVVADHVFYDRDANRTTTQQPDHDNWDFLETTAVEGEDYQIRDGGIITIPAYNSFGSLHIELFPTSDRIMYIVLVEGDVQPSKNYKIFRLRIRP